MALILSILLSINVFAEETPLTTLGVVEFPPSEEKQAKYYELFEGPSRSSKSFGKIEIKKLSQKDGAKKLCHEFSWLDSSGKKNEFIPDSVRLGQMQYTHTYIDCEKTWFKLPAKPFAKPVWVELPEQRCDKSQYGGIANGIITLFKSIPLDKEGKEYVSSVAEHFVQEVRDGSVFLVKYNVRNWSSERKDYPNDDDPEVLDYYNKNKVRLEKELGRKLNELERYKLIESAKAIYVRNNNLIEHKTIKVNLSSLVDKDNHIAFKFEHGNYSEACSK